jgi:hypothetical protein
MAALGAKGALPLHAIAVGRSFTQPGHATDSASASQFWTINISGAAEGLLSVHHKAPVSKPSGTPKPAGAW